MASQRTPDTDGDAIDMSLSYYVQVLEYVYILYAVAFVCLLSVEGMDCCTGTTLTWYTYIYRRLCWRGREPFVEVISTKRNIKQE